MLRVVEGETRDTKPDRHPEHVRELAYAVWASECNRHAARTAARLAEVLDPGEAVPSRQVVANWAERHGWHPRADEEMRRLAPALHRRLTAQLFAIAPRAVETIDRINRGDPELAALPNAMIAAMERSAWETVRVLGIGTHGAKGGEAKVDDLPGEGEEGRDLTPAQKQRRLAEKLAASRQARGR